MRFRYNSPSFGETGTVLLDRYCQHSTLQVGRSKRAIKISFTLEKEQKDNKQTEEIGENKISRDSMLQAVEEVQ